MKFFSVLLFIILFAICCSKKRTGPLINKVEDFKISECQSNCGIDSVGVIKNKLIDDTLYLKIGQIVNCAWEEGFLESLEYKNDTLLLGLDRPADVDTLNIDTTMVKGEQIITMDIVETYPLYDCDCFFYFELSLKDFYEIPEVIRLFEGEGANENDYWDKIPKKSFESEEIEIEF